MTLSELAAIAIIEAFRTGSVTNHFIQLQSRNHQGEGNNSRGPAMTKRVSTRGQVAQVVERSPEKAGVGGSTPSLATTFQSSYIESAKSLQSAFSPPVLAAVAPPRMA